MSITGRTICLYVSVIAVIVVFVGLFKWFPINELKPWIFFVICFGVSSIGGFTVSVLKEKAENQAIHIFGENLRNYLLQPPMKGKTVLGVDPAFRTGCKLAVVDATGKLLEKSVMYPHQKSKDEVVPPGRYANAVEIFKDLVLRHNVEVVAMGNGTASRETEAFVASTLGAMKEQLDALGREVKYIIVNEAGASVYSASDIARDEFPDFSVEERSAISIARRLQDPLAELVKIDPKSIGVGQYQHDVTQSKLAESLDFVVTTAVNQVGVNINTASPSLLKYVAGLNAGVKALTGKTTTEWISDAVLDTGEAIGNAAKNVSESIGSWFRKLSFT